MPIKSSNKKKMETECVICATRETNCRTVECNHQFCYRCLSKWGRRKGTCPLCRTDIRKIQYKNRIIAPQYLSEFDERIIFSQDQSNDLPRPRRSEDQVPLVFAPSYNYFIPFIYVSLPQVYVQPQ